MATVPEASRERCLVTDPGTKYTCSLIPGHAGQHEAWDGHQVGLVGGCLSVWPQETEPAEVVDERDEVAKRLDAFEERLQRLRDDTRDAAAAAGEALERTKGLQVPEILRRLGQTERRVNLMDGGRVARETAPDDRLLNAVTDLTTVMREAVAAQREGAVLVRRGLDALTPPEVCGARIPFSDGVTCDREKDHDGAHHPLAGSALKPEPRTCAATLRLSNTELGCVLDKGHIGPHQDRDDDTWTVTGV